MTDQAPPDSDAILPGDRGAWDRGYNEGYMSGWKACERYSDKVLGDVDRRVSDARWIGTAIGLTVGAVITLASWLVPL